MDRESFLEILRTQFADEIRAAYVECEHEHGKVDRPLLDSRLKRLSAQAALRGFPAKEFDELVRSVLPADVSAA